MDRTGEKTLSNSYFVCYTVRVKVVTHMSKIYTVTELRDALSPIFAEHGVRSAILFGSYSKGQATERSDVDLLVDSGLRGLAFFGLLEGVASALDVPVDMIDVSQVERGSPVELEIKRSGVQIYGQ